MVDFRGSGGNYVVSIVVVKRSVLIFLPSATRLSDRASDRVIIPLRDGMKRDDSSMGKVAQVQRLVLGVVGM